MCCAALIGILSFSPAARTGTQALSEDNESEIRAHYTKYEVRIPMRDGVKLFTAVYSPKDTSQTYPFLLSRTPYGIPPYGVDHYPKRFGSRPHLPT